VETNFPRNSRMAAIQYGTSAEILFNFDYETDRNELANLIRGMQQLGKLL
jgi:hypothetical protein